jgi:hypothetical protein
MCILKAFILLKIEMVEVGVVQHLFCKFRLGYFGQMKKTGMKKGMNLQNRCYTTN